MRAAEPTVLLFDIDGTLLETGGAGRASMAGAFADVHGRAEAASGFSYAGMTDRAIVRRGLAALSVEATDEAIEAVLAAYLVRLADEVARSPSYRVLPGVTELVPSLLGLAHVAVGLGTGNVREGAYTKLRRGGIDGHFAFGGFGCDAEDRTELLRAGARRGAAALGAEVAACRVIVIGDTPKDVAAALGIGAACVGVGTGGTSAADLVALGARWGFATLADPGVRQALLEGA